MIKASDRCALILRAAIKASSASTTAWPVVPCSLKPTANYTALLHYRNHPLAKDEHASFANIVQSPRFGARRSR
jgi:hypothetical protein